MSKDEKNSLCDTVKSVNENFLSFFEWNLCVEEIENRKKSFFLQKKSGILLFQKKNSKIFQFTRLDFSSFIFFLSIWIIYSSPWLQILWTVWLCVCVFVIAKLKQKKKKEIPLNFVSILNYFFVEKNKKECKRIKSDENAFTYDTYVYEKYK